MDSTKFSTRVPTVWGTPPGLSEEVGTAPDIFDAASTSVSFETHDEVTLNPVGRVISNCPDKASQTLKDYYSNFNFNSYLVIKPIDLTALQTLCAKNISNLQLPHPSKKKPISRSCPFLALSGEASSATSDSTHLRKTLNSPKDSRHCHVCGATVKGKRGLHLHLSRSPTCKRNCPSNLLPPHNPATLPQLISNTIKSPSTTVEGLEHSCSTHHTGTMHYKSNGCCLCDIFSHKDKFVSTSTHRIHNSIIPANTKSLNCNVTNLIYLITCRNCKLQYVGETVQHLRERICAHLYGIKNPLRESKCRILTEHFSQGSCKGSKFSVHIIEKVSGTGRVGSTKTIDPDVTCIRKSKEKDWMLKLRTVYPYGLNDRIGDEYDPNKEQNIFSRFPSLSRNKSRNKIRTKLPVSTNTILNNFIYIVNESIRSNLKNTMNLIRALLSSLNKPHCRLLFDRINDYISSKPDSYLYFQYFLAALDLLKYKIGNPSLEKNCKKQPPSNTCHILFNNKAIDSINIHRILRDKGVCKTLPPDLRKNSPTVVYNLTSPIRSKLFNYKEFVQSLNVNAFINDNSILPCQCAQSHLTNPDHHHIISGDLSIVDNTKLRNLISKGPKYREPLPFSVVKARENILAGIDDCIRSWSNREGLPIDTFKDWKTAITSKIEDRISSISVKQKKSSSSVLKDASASACLSDLHSKFVMVPVDKAANNIAFICKRYYAQVLITELGLTGSPSPTYSIINDCTPERIISKHKADLKRKFKISIPNDMLSLPDIYWTPKLHKNPVKHRFIIASKTCSTKTLSKNVSSIFSLFQRQISAYHQKTHFYTGIKSYWIVNDRRPILKAVDRSVARRSARSLTSFDFSTLYTKIPHDKLIMVLNGIIDFAFRGGKRENICVSKSGIASWKNENDTSSHSGTIYSKSSIKKAVSYLIKNCYFKLGDQLFRQNIGIPMGSDPAPAFANLFLFHYESEWLNKIKKTNTPLARKFQQVFRYIDDLLAMNDGLAFETHYQDIYPPELELTKENIDISSTNFLDLHIEIVDRIFTTKLYDKRDNFGFHINRLPFRSSNIPDKMFYSSIGAECLRICRGTSTSNQAKISIKSVTDRMMSQGANFTKMKNSIVRILNRHNINDKFRQDTFTNRLF